MSSPVVIEVIEHCWTRIEPYLDIISLISVSKSCNKLRQLVIDEDSGKIKASILKVPPNLEDDCPYGPISEHGPRLLNLVHFPSLKKLDIAFPWIFKIRSDHRTLENNFPLALPTLANLSQDAYNLEVLSINIDDLIAFEDSGRPQVAYNILKNNLIRCINRTKKLRDLSICNNRDDKSYSTAFFDAMVPVIKEGVCLESVNLFCGGSPSSSDHADALHDFLEAALSLQNLKNFRINALLIDEYAHLINSIMSACQSIEKSWGEIPSKKLKSFCLLWAGPGKSDSDIQLQPIHQMLSLLSEVKSLEMLFLWLPLSYWNRDNISAICSYIERPSLLKSFGADFQGYEDNSGKLVSIMQKVVKDKPSTHVWLQRIGYLAEQSDSIQALGHYVEKKEKNGGTAWDFEYDPDK